MQTHFIAPLLSQTELDLNAIGSTDEILVTKILTKGLNSRAKKHKLAIQSHAATKSKAQTLEKELVAAQKEASRIRKLERKNLKEKLRIYHLENEVTDLMIKAPLVEWKPSTPLFDLRFAGPDSLYEPTGQSVKIASPQQGSAVFVPGGLLGQILLTFGALTDLIQSKDNYGEYRLSPSEMQSVLTNLLTGPECHFPKGALTLVLGKDPEQSVQEDEEGENEKEEMQS